MGTARHSHSVSRRRPRSISYMTSLRSVTSLHAETVNIWSHLLGTIWFGASAVRFTVARTEPLTQDAVGILIYLAATTLCFASSTIYHVFADHVHACFWLHIDHLGIVCEIWAASVSFVLTTLECRRGEWWVCITIVTAAAALSFNRLARVQEHHVRSRKDRLSAHIAFGVVAAMPAMRCWYVHAEGEREGQRAKLLEAFWSLVILNGLGGSVYATHLLDKAMGIDLGFPDISHHVMHITAVAGAWMYQEGLLAVFEARTAEQDCVRE